MKTFIRNLALFLFCTMVFAGMIVLFLPNPAIQGNILYANRDKQARLQTLPSPKVIIVGGSNASMGINSAVLQDSLGLPIVNMAIHGGLGLFFMMNEVLPYVKPGDKVVLLPDYSQFFGKTAYGEVELAALMIDANPEASRYVPLKQKMLLFKKTIEYAISKIKFPVNSIQMYFLKRTPDNWVYRRTSANEYGDINIHWNKPKIAYGSFELEDSLPINEEVISRINTFKTEVEKRNAFFYLLPPCMETTSFKKLKPTITRIGQKLEQSHLVDTYEAEKFSYPDSLCFDHPFHLRGAAVEENSRRIYRSIQ